MQSPCIHFRPHHFMCTLAFKGRGYSPEFIANYKIIFAQLQKDPHTLIEVQGGPDAICQACPHKVSDSSCTKQDLIAQLDGKHAAILNIKTGDVLTWTEARQRLKTHMTLDRFHDACQGCGWKKLGICAAALARLQSEAA